MIVIFAIKKCNIFPVMNFCIIVQKARVTAIIIVEVLFKPIVVVLLMTTVCILFFPDLTCLVFRAKDSLGDLEINGTSQDTGDGSQTVVSIIVA